MNEEPQHRVTVTFTPEHHHMDGTMHVMDLAETSGGQTSHEHVDASQVYACRDCYERVTIVFTLDVDPWTE